MGRHFERGQALFHLGRFREAAEEYQQELTENPDSLGAHLNLGLALINLGNLRESEDSIRNAMGIAPEYAYCYYALSKAKAAQGFVLEAEELVSEAIRLDPRVADFYVALAQFRLHWFRYPEALEAITDALKCDPSNIGGLIVKADIESRTGNVAEAENLLNTALGMEAENPQLHAYIGTISLKKNENPNALDSLKEARRIDPTEYLNPDQLALAYGRQCWPFVTIDRFLRYVQPWDPVKKWSFIALACSTIVGWQFVRQRFTPNSPGLETFAIIFLSILTMYVLFPSALISPAKAVGRIYGRKDLRLKLSEAVNPELFSSFFFLFGLHFIAISLALGATASPIMAYILAAMVANLMLFASLPTAVPYAGLLLLIVAIGSVAALAANGAILTESRPFLSALYWMSILAISYLGSHTTRVAKRRPPDLNN